MYSSTGENLLRTRRKYGGADDKQHLGGFSEINTGGIPPPFKHMVSSYGIHSFLDVGCGRGFSTSWFAFHGADVLCVEGSNGVVERSVLPDPKSMVVEHDFFLEDVNLQLHYNYVRMFL